MFHNGFLIVWHKVFLFFSPKPLWVSGITSQINSIFHDIQILQFHDWNYVLYVPVLYPAIVWRDNNSFLTSHPGTQQVQEFLLTQGDINRGRPKRDYFTCIYRALSCQVFRLIDTNPINKSESHEHLYRFVWRWLIDLTNVFFRRHSSPLRCN